jgi:hypothetical protein
MWGNFGSSCLICKDSKDRDATWGTCFPKFHTRKKTSGTSGDPGKPAICMRRAGKDLSPSDFTGLLVVYFSTRMKWTGQKNQSVVRKMEITRNSELEHITSQPWQGLGLARIENIARVLRYFDWLQLAAKKLCQQNVEATLLRYACYTDCERCGCLKCGEATLFSSARLLGCCDLSK